MKNKKTDNLSLSFFFICGKIIFFFLKHYFLGKLTGSNYINAFIQVDE